MYIKVAFLQITYLNNPSVPFLLWSWKMSRLNQGENKWHGKTMVFKTRRGRKKEELFNSVLVNTWFGWYFKKTWCFQLQNCHFYSFSPFLFGYRQMKYYFIFISFWGDSKEVSWFLLLWRGYQLGVQLPQEYPVHRHRLLLKYFLSKDVVYFSVWVKFWHMVNFATEHLCCWSLPGSASL